MINKLGSEVRVEIVQRIAEDDRTPLIATLPCVDQKTRGIAVESLHSRVLPRPEKVGEVAADLPIVTCCRRLQMEPTHRIPLGDRHWQNHIHVVIKELLKNGDDEANRQHLLNLIQARTDLNARTSQNQTPLLILCDSVGTLFSDTKLQMPERRIRYANLVVLMKQLLENGADPNLESSYLTPLGTIFSNQPRSPLDRDLMQTLLSLFLAHGADANRRPPKNTVYLNKTPLERAADYEIYPPKTK